MPSGRSITPKPGACVRQSGFYQISVGQPEGPAGFLERKVIAVNGAGFATVPRVLVSEEVIRSHAGKGFEGKSLRGLLYSEELMSAVRGDISRTLSGFGGVPLCIRPERLMQDLSKPLYSRGVAPLPSDSNSVDEAFRHSLFISQDEGGGGVVIQPAFGEYAEAGPYGTLYGPVVSGIATLGSSIQTTLSVGYTVSFQGAIVVDESDKRPLKEVLGSVRSSHYIQVRQRNTNLTTISHIPSSELLAEPLDWLFSRLGRLKQFAGSGLVAEWAAIAGSFRPQPAILRLAELRSEENALLSGRPVHGRGKTECSGLVYEYAMNPRSLRSLDSSLRGYALVCRATNAVNSGLSPDYFQHATAVVVVIDQPENAHKVSGFLDRAGAAGKIVITVSQDALLGLEGKVPGMETMHPGYMVSSCRLSVDAESGSVRVIG